MRTEKDSLGAVEIDDEAPWGAQTERARHHFRAGPVVPAPILRALLRIKKATATTNAALGVLEPHLRDVVLVVVDELLAGDDLSAFPLRVFQSGSGTQSHVNVNEVIANLANERLGTGRGSKSPVHPSDHVNASQSTNDVFPTALRVACATALRDELFPALTGLKDALQVHAIVFADVPKSGRTHLMDAVPLTLGQEIEGWIGQLVLAEEALRDAFHALLEVPLGGTAVGTGLNTPPGYAERAVEALSEITGLSLRPARVRAAHQAGQETLVRASSALRGLAVALYKLSNDLRLLASGPRCGLGEVRLPANEPGSSIMPGKVNPTQNEALCMICAQVLGNDAAVAFAGTQGQFQLNANLPVIGANLLDSVELLAEGMRGFTEHCVVGLEADEERLTELVERTLMRVTALAPRIGYDAAAKAALLAHRQGTGLEEAVVGQGVLDAETFRQLTDPLHLARPHRDDDGDAG